MGGLNHAKVQRASPAAPEFAPLTVTLQESLDDAVAKALGRNSSDAQQSYAAPSW
jgi:hypothetical protein